MKTIWCNFLREKHFEKMRWAEAIIAPKKTSCFGPLENFFLQGTKTTTTHAYSLLCENKFHYSLYLGSATGWSIWIDHNSIIVINCNAYFPLMIVLGALYHWKIYILLFFKVGLFLYQDFGYSILDTLYYYITYCGLKISGLLFNVLF